MTDRIPVVIAGINCLSGVTTWAEQLRAVLATHPRYQVQLLYIGDGRPDGFDLYAPHIEAAKEAVRKLSPVIVVPNYVWELFLIGFEPKIYCVGMCHADDDEQYYRPLSWYEPVISKFIAVSRECTDRLTNRIPCRAYDITMLPYGIRVPRTLQRDYQVEPLRLVYAGRVTQLQKRVWDFLPLVEQLFETRVPFVFDIVGEGDAFDTLKLALQSRFGNEVVRFQRRVPHHEMPAIWTRHDVFIQVSDFEGTSVSMLEAMAHGVVPVVTAASSGIEGVIHREQNGSIVPVGDMAAMAHALARLAANRPLLSKLGGAAHQTAHEYSLDQYSEKFARFLDGVLAAGKEVDPYQRYGMFGDTHPMLKQWQLIVRQQQEIARLQQSTVRRLFDSGYQRLKRSTTLRPTKAQAN